MLKKTIKLFFAILMMAGFTTTVMAQTTNKVTGTTAGAVIITPLLLTQVTPLHFGVMAVQGGTGGTCVLATNGVRTTTGGVNLSAQAPLKTNAAYTVVGQASTTYAVTLPASITVTNGTPAQDMIINAILARFTGAGADGVTSTLSNPGGTGGFTVGGTLNVAAAQAAGTYAGSFDVSVDYN